jgi:hypothetical protein
MESILFNTMTAAVKYLRSISTQRGGDDHTRKSNHKNHRHGDFYIFLGVAFLFLRRRPDHIL